MAPPRADAAGPSTHPASTGVAYKRRQQARRAQLRREAETRRLFSAMIHHTAHDEANHSTSDLRQQVRTLQTAVAELTREVAALSRASAPCQAEPSSKPGLERDASTLSLWYEEAECTRLDAPLPLGNQAQGPGSPLTFRSPPEELASPCTPHRTMTPPSLWQELSESTAPGGASRWTACRMPSRDPAHRVRVHSGHGPPPEKCIDVWVERPNGWTHCLYLDVLASMRSIKEFLFINEILPDMDTCVPEQRVTSYHHIKFTTAW